MLLFKNDERVTSSTWTKNQVLVPSTKEREPAWNTKQYKNNIIHCVENLFDRDIFVIVILVSYIQIPRTSVQAPVHDDSVKSLKDFFYGGKIP